MPVAGGGEGHGALAGLGRRHPLPVAHAAHSLPVPHERLIAAGQPGPAPLAVDHPGQHRVVPVHGPAVLGGEGLGAAVADGVGQPGQRQLPARPLRAQLAADGQGAAQAVGDGRRPGQQGERPRGAVGVAGPQDLAPRGLQAQHEVDGPRHHRGHSGQKAPVAVQQVVVPHPGGRVGDDVGVELELLGPVGCVVLVPGAVGPLDVGQPLVGGFGLGSQPGRGQGHGRLHVVPRVGVAAREPGDHPRRELPLGDGGGGEGDLFPAQHPGHLRRSRPGLRRHGPLLR